MKIYYEHDADLGFILGKKVAVLGFGSQGHAHALNLKDSGVDVRVGLRKGSRSWEKAEAAGLRVLPVAEAVHFAHRHGFVHRDLKPGNRNRFGERFKKIHANTKRLSAI